MLLEFITTLVITIVASCVFYSIGYYMGVRRGIDYCFDRWEEEMKSGASDYEK